MKEIFQKESLSRKLSYTASFKEVVARYPKLFGIFQDLEKRMKDRIQAGQLSVGDFLEDEGVKVTLIEKPQIANKQPLGSYLKVEVNGEAFFVKTVPGFYSEGAGTKELVSLKKAKKLLKDLKDVEVVDFQLGYQDNKGTTYFVSKWEDGIVLENYLQELEIRIGQAGDVKLAHDITVEQGRLMARFEEIHLLLEDRFSDVSEGNIFYNPKTQKLTVFDVHSFR